MKTFTSGSFARAILVTLLLVSIVPILIISITFVNQSTASLTEQMEANLELLVRAKAEEIDLRLNQVVAATEIAADQVAFSLQTDVSDEAVDQGLARYAPDQRDIYGLDVYYNQAGGEGTLGVDLSNVYWPSPTVDSAVGEQIIQTESLDATFRAIKEVSPNSQWIYFTTKEGMMRLYPWASNDHYPDDWDPREILFYTVAEPGNNPDMTTRWTPPYVDFAGAGWMVTVSTPIVNKDEEFMGVMSHDITIQSLKDIALTINVLNGAGFGFLIDKEGNVITHPDYEGSDASQGSQETVNLLEVGTPDYQAVIQRMAAGETGLGSYHSEVDGDEIIVYAPIPSIDWRLGIVVPRTEVVAPAVAMRTRAFIITLGLVIAAAIIAVFLTGRIHRPLAKLLAGVHQLSAESRPDDITVDSFREFRELANAFNEMTAKVWARETKLKKTVAELRIEIDTQRSQKELHALTETDYFQFLESNAERIRKDVRGGLNNDGKVPQS
jgi:HAMP domain-containing protein